MTHVTVNKPAYLGLSILDLNKIAMYEFWYDYIKPKYGENANFVIWIKTTSLSMQIQDILTKDIAKAVDKRFDTSSFEIGRPLPLGKNKKVIVLIKDEVGAQIMKDFVGLRAKIYSYLKENIDEDKKAKGTKSVQ